MYRTVVCVTGLAGNATHVSRMMTSSRAIADSRGIERAAVQCRAEAHGCNGCGGGQSVANRNNGAEVVEETEIPKPAPILTCPYDNNGHKPSLLFASRKTYCLSGKPKSTPNSGYTYLLSPPLRSSSGEYSSSVFMSSLSKLIIFLFSSMRDGVTDLARTELPRATENSQ